MEPAANVKKFINQAGVLVRDIIPITIPDWHKPKNAADNEASYVSDTTKDLIWGNLLPHFNLPENFTEGQKEKVKEWTLKKMAVQFQRWKKKLWDKYGAEGSEFSGRLEKLKDHWPAFKAYRYSSTYSSRSAFHIGISRRTWQKIKLIMSGTLQRN